jgi:hypothetical protein
MARPPIMTDRAPVTIRRLDQDGAPSADVGAGAAIYNPLILALYDAILAIPVVALAGRLRLAGMLSAIVIAEVVVLALNSMRCPLTDVAARCTESRGDSFDIYTPAWMARNNKRIFGTFWVLGELVLVGC